MLFLQTIVIFNLSLGMEVNKKNADLNACEERKARLANKRALLEQAKQKLNQSIISEDPRDAST